MKEKYFIIGIVVFLIGGTFVIGMLKLNEQPNWAILSHTMPVAASTCGNWTVWSGTDAGFGTSRLTAVALVTSDDIWAVGDSQNALGAQQGLIVHWNGSRWEQQQTRLDLSDSSLVSLAVVSEDDVWAVGTKSGQTLVIHWDGIAWMHIPSPNPDAISNNLRSITAISKDDIWAVGDYGRYTPSTLIMHWDGTSWNVVPSPNPGKYQNNLRSITAISKDDIWAVGDYGLGDGSRTLTIHWDGKTWTVVTSPSPDFSNADNEMSRLFAVAASNSKSVWAVGSLQVYRGAEAITMHWDGNSWRMIASPQFGSIYGLSNAIAFPNTSIWSVGGRGGYESGHTLVEYWDGSRWLDIPSPSPAEKQRFWAVTGSSSNDIWAVGHAGNRALIGHFSKTDCKDHSTAWGVSATRSSGPTALRPAR